jgi:chromosome segregation ATPase
VLGGQEGLMQQVSDLKQEVSDMMKELSQGMTLDQQTMERMSQLQQLLSELLPRELQQSLAQLRDKLEQQSPDVKRALEKFELDQEKMKQAIDRALELLKKVMEEQRLEALAKKAEELAKAQEELTEKLGKEPGERSAQMEQELKDALDSLQKEMQSLADSMSDKEIGDSLAKLAEQAEQEKLSEMAQELANQMKQGKPEQAKPKSGKLGQSLRKMSQSLNSLSKKLKSKRSSEVAKELSNAAQDLLMVSDEQEKLEQASTGMADLSPNAAQEMGLHEAARIVAESLVSLSSRSMSVDPGLGQELAKAMAAMERAAQAMVDNRAEVAQPSMAQARQGLNRTVQALLRAMAEAQKGGGMSSGMEGLMQQLSQMTGEQMGINAGTSGFPIPMPGGLSVGQMGELGRILGKQRALREQLEQMLQQMGGTQPGLTSSLEGLLDEMKAVEKDLSELNVSRELIQRQESILSHLLDAQRSIRQQGFKEERESESGKGFEVQPKPRLPEDKGERNRLLREELMRALKQGYPAEYEQMIRDYFQRLLDER